MKYLFQSLLLGVVVSLAPACSDDAPSKQCNQECDDCPPKAGFTCTGSDSTFCYYCQTGTYCTGNGTCYGQRAWEGEVALDEPGASSPQLQTPIAGESTNQGEE